MVIDDCHWITACVLKSRRWCVNCLKRFQLLHSACCLSFSLSFFPPAKMLSLLCFHRAGSITHQPLLCACILPAKLKRPFSGGHKLGQLLRFICFSITSSIFLNSTSNGIPTWVLFKLKIRPKNIKNSHRNYVCWSSCWDLLSLYSESPIISWSGSYKFKLLILN